MSYINGTPHYNLPQTVGTDKRDWFDTNEPFATIDAAIHTAGQTASSAASQVTALDSRVDGIDIAIAGIQSDITEVQGDVNALDMRVSSLAGTVDDNYIDLTDAICSIKEASATAQYFHHNRSFFWYNDTLYKATDDIQVGQQIVPNTNCVTTNITSEIYKGVVEIETTTTTTYAQALNALFAQVDVSKITSTSTLVFEHNNNEYWAFQPCQHQEGIVDFGAVTYGCRLQSMRMSSTLSSCDFTQIEFGDSGTFIYRRRSSDLVGGGKRVLLVY